MPLYIPDRTPYKNFSCLKNAYQYGTTAPVPSASVIYKDSLFIGTRDGRIYSMGKHKNAARIPIGNYPILGLCVYKNNIYCIAGSQIFKSDNDGKSWVLAFSSTTPELYGIATNGETLVIAGKYVAIISTDGSSFTENASVPWGELFSKSANAFKYIEEMKIFVALSATSGASGTGRAQFFISTDGISYGVKVVDDLGAPQAIKYYAGKLYIAMGYNQFASVGKYRGTNLLTTQNFVDFSPIPGQFSGEYLNADSGALTPAMFVTALNVFKGIIYISTQIGIIYMMEGSETEIAFNPTPYDDYFPYNTSISEVFDDQYYTSFNNIVATLKK